MTRIGALKRKKKYLEMLIKKIDAQIKLEQKKPPYKYVRK